VSFEPLSFRWVLLFGGAGLVTGWISIKLVEPILQAPIFRRRNYRDAELGIGSGLALVVAYLFIGAAGTTVAASTFADTKPDAAWVQAIATLSLPPVLGFALLGLIDDLAAVGSDRGYRGHLRALARGRLTTGSLKLFGGGAIALLVSRPQQQPVRWLLSAAAVALGANLGNLFDRAPGRCLKVGVLGLLAVLGSMIGSSSFIGPPTSCFLGVVIALLPSDLRETTMLGDTGSNVIGAGVAFIGASRLYDQPTAMLVLFVGVLLALNLASEVVSFSKVIDAVAPLRWFDRLGTVPERKAHANSSMGPSSGASQ
jgi:UDP-GlcNAc:undecaprenyl-phosphate/decaprenyl-phosphate GlcNAc-1-phosphate transferase